MLQPGSVRIAGKCVAKGRNQQRNTIFRKGHELYQGDLELADFPFTSEDEEIVSIVDGDCALPELTGVYKLDNGVSMC
jgi:hypothetical protein